MLQVIKDICVLVIVWPAGLEIAFAIFIMVNTRDVDFFLFTYSQAGPVLLILFMYRSAPL